MFTHDRCMALFRIFSQNSLEKPVNPNAKHCPMQFDRIDSPVLVFTIGMACKHTLNPSEKKL